MVERLTSVGVRRGWVRALARMSAVAAVTIGAASAAQASIYQVYTSSIPAMTINANDGYCSLAEAIASASAGHSMYNCPEIFPGGSQDIQLLEASGKSFSSFHFVITSFTINAPGQTISIYSQSATNHPFIDSTGFPDSSSEPGRVFFGGINFTYTGGSAGGRMIENYGTLDLSGVDVLKRQRHASHQRNGRRPLQQGDRHRDQLVHVQEQQGQARRRHLQRQRDDQQHEQDDHLRKLGDDGRRRDLQRQRPRSSRPLLPTFLGRT